jgi:hypothetical protein
MEYLQLRNNEILPQIKTQRPFKCVVIISSPVSQAWQAKVSQWLVDSGCLYMMAWGNDCNSWDDSVDYANIEQFQNQEIPPESFVMTTWHESESLSEVFEFCKHAAIHGVKNVENTLLLHISEEYMSKNITQIYNGA